MITSGVAGSIRIPPTIDGTSCSRNRNRVATPKLPPPPRIAQKRSGCVLVVHLQRSRRRRSRPRRRAGRRSSCRTSGRGTRSPPPSVMPPMPTEAVSPKPVARPCSPAAFVYSPAVSPVSAHAVRSSASMSSAFIAERSRTIPPSETPNARPAVAAAPDGQLDARVARERHDGRDLRGVDGPNDDRRPPVDVAGEHRPRVVVAAVLGGDHLAAEILAELRDRDRAWFGDGSHRNLLVFGVPSCLQPTFGRWPPGEIHRRFRLS